MKSGEQHNIGIDKWWSAAICRKCGHGGAQKSDRAGAENRDAVARLDARVVDDSVESHAARLGQRGDFKRQFIGHAMKAARGNTHPARHRAIDAITETLARRVEVIQTLAAHRVVGIDNGGGFRNRALAFTPPRNALAQFANRAGEFVAQYDRIINRPTVVARPLMQVAAAHSDRPHFKQNIVWPDARRSYFAQLDAAAFRRVIDNSGCHISTHGCRSSTFVTK